VKVRRLWPVDDEVIEAVQYYRAIDPKLSDRLIAELEATVLRLVHFPESGRPLANDLRQCALKVFPFVLIYKVLADEILIIAFANTHRRPAYWRDSLKKRP